METIAIYSIDDTEYELYKAASGDYCVSISKYGEERKDYNIGNLKEALLFILKEYECE